MKLLEYYYDHPPQSSNYISRKLEIPTAPLLNLYGVRGAGKSSLVIEYLQEFETGSFLYIDCSDPNFIFEPLNIKTLQPFIESHSIKLVVLDHFEKDLLRSLPQSQRLIVVTRIKLKEEKFISAQLFLLDYEEFLSRDLSASATSSFNHFLKQGTLPLMSKIHNANSQEFKIFLQSRFDAQEINLFVVLSRYQTHRLTVHQIYNVAKEHFKVSKDWLYKKIKEFQEEGILSFLEDTYLKGGKKMILFDFSLSKYCMINQSFLTTFEAMVALELIKRQSEVKSLGQTGYIVQKKELIIPAPFEGEVSMWKKSHAKFAFYRQFCVQKVIIVTVANSYEFIIENLEFEAMPFYEWSIINEEE